MSWWSETDEPLSPAETGRLGLALDTGEQVVRFIRGRIDGKRTILAATDRRVIIVGVTWRGRVQALAFTEVRGLETEEGAHGWTVRLLTSAGRYAAVAVHPALGAPFVEAVAARSGAPSSFIASRRPTAPEQRRVATAPALPAAAADATRTATHPSGDMLAQLREAADLHQSGALTDDEFTALKRRLLGS